MPKSPGARSLVLTALLAMLVSVLAPVAVDAQTGGGLDAPGGLEAVDVGDSQPRLQWDPEPGATQYRIQLSTVANFASTLVSQTTSTNSFAPPDELPEGTIYWRVEARVDSTWSGYGSPASFEKLASAPTALAPADDVVLDFPEDPPTFSWTSIPGARSYVLEVDDSEQFQNSQKFVTSGTTYTMRINQDIGQTYHWRVRGSSNTNGTGTLTSWSQPRTYHVTWDDVAELVHPPHESTITDVRMEWTPVPGADRYRIEVSVADDFTSLVVGREVYDTVYSPPTTLNNGSYYWRVQAIDYEGDRTAWSQHPSGEPFEFTRGWADVPGVVYPLAVAPTASPATQVDPPYFQWTPIPHAGRYEVQVGTDINFSNGTFSSCYTPHTIVTPSSSGGPGGCSIFGEQYGQLRYWRVRGIDGSVLGNWSDVHAFVRQPLKYPDLLSPTPGQHVNVPTLDWEALEHSTRYRVRILRPNGTDLVSETTTASSFTYTGSSMTPGETYRWYVVPVGHDNVQGQFPTVDSPAWRTFTYDGPLADSGTIHLLTPAAGASTTEMPSMTWTPLTGADRYQVVYQEAGVPTQYDLSTTGLRHPGYTHSDQEFSPGMYEWRVQAFDGNTLVGVSEWRALTVVSLGAAVQHPPDPCPTHGPACTLTTSPELSWEPVPHANFYEVWLAFDANFTNPYRKYTVPNTWFRPREEIRDSNAGEVYYWHVRPCIESDRCGPDPQGVLAPSQTFQKRSDPVLLSAPADNATVTVQPRFSWQQYLDTNSNDVAATWYEIEVSQVASFANRVEIRQVDQPFFTPYVDTYPEGPLYWRVRAIDASGNDLAWSVSRKVDYQSPPVALQTPAHNANLNGQPAFSWTPTVGAGRYDIEVFADDPDRTFSPAKRVFIATTAHAAFTPSEHLPVGNGYSWRVRREDGGSKDGPWGAGRVFNITSAAPSLVSPANNAKFHTPDLVFDWNPVPRATRYRIQTSNNGFSSTRESQITVMTTWSTTTTYAQGMWQWRVQALDAQNNVIGTSTPQSFERITTPLPSAPRNLTVTPSPGRLTIRWQPPSDEGDPAFTSYRITITRPGDDPIVINNIPSGATQSIVAGLMNGINHQVTIEARAGAYYGAPAVKPGTPNGCSGTPFSDVSSGHTFCEDIRWLYQEGVTTGSPGSGGAINFLPTATVSRQSMAAFLYRYSGDGAPNTATPYFADVGSGTFYEPIQWMWEAGLSFGSPNPGGGKPFYLPTTAVSRGSMAAFVHRFEDLGHVPATVPQHFVDVASSHTFYQDIQWMYETNLSVGTQTSGGLVYRPATPMSRQAMAAFLHRLDNAITDAG